MSTSFFSECSKNDFFLKKTLKYFLELKQEDRLVPSYNKKLLAGYLTTKNVRGTNRCHIGVLADPRTDKIIVVATLDNLTKGASGQALQCFNLMFDFPEETGLENPPLFP